MKPDSWPPALSTAEPGSFARRTIEQRKHTIIADVIATGLYTPAQVAALQGLDAEIGDGVLTDPWRAAAVDGPPLREPERAAWQRELRPVLGASWLAAPWYLAEAYFYLRLLHACGYYDRNGAAYMRDPFAPMKQRELDAAGRELAAQLLDAPAPLLLRSALWGNRLDLSNYEIDRGSAAAVTAAGGDQLVVDHTGPALRALAAAARVDYVTDNSGAELVCDLLLIDALLRGALAAEATATRQVRLHVKDAPFFVSDAMPADVMGTLLALQRHADGGVCAVADRLLAALAANRLVISSHWFWNGPCHLPQLPRALGDELAQADLLVFKGDVNYRRLLSDRHWPPDTATDAVVDYLGVPALVLRTLKSEIITGLAPGAADALAAADPAWLINGRRGIVQLVPTPSSTSGAAAHGSG